MTCSFFIEVFVVQQKYDFVFNKWVIIDMRISFVSEGARLECGRSWVSSPGRVKPKTIKLVFVASPLSTQH